MSARRASSRSESEARIRVRVQPRASLNQILVDPDDRIRIRVTAAPTDGKANDAVVALVADAIGLAKSRVTLVSGHTSREKLLAIFGLNERDILALLRQTS